VETGLFYQLPVSNGQQAVTRYHQTLQQVALADALGYHSAWFAEFHFAESFSALPSPFVFMAAAAVLTRRIRLGTAAVIPALHHPVRLVEEAAMLDLLSHGRLELALGRGGIECHFRGYGADVAQRGEKLLEALAFLKQTWHMANPVDANAVKTLPLADIAPLPLQQPHPPVSIVANSVSTACFAAEYGYNCIINSVVNPLTQGFYEIGHSFHRSAAAGHLSAVIPVLITENRSALHQVRRSFLKYLGAYGGSFPELAGKLGVSGTAAECADQLAQIRHRAGLQRVIAWFNPGGLVSHERIKASMAQFSQAAGDHIGIL
jgi:alkanesulfonate monooxygenase SsuD/methylene tetrahydromethanopterin reductase-like flavin-dependent oxidoreductase (luciferase family)